MERVGEKGVECMEVRSKRMRFVTCTRNLKTVNLINHITVKP